MILSISRRTDIPAFYSEWLVNRFNAGFVYVKNPFNANQISSIDLTENIDGIVFWSKNPQPLMKYLPLFKDIPYYFQFTLNSYDTTLENSVPEKKILIHTFKALSDLIGPERVIWRYDPIILTDRFTIDYHKRYFEIIAEKLEGYTEKCVISFVDMYKKCQENMKDILITTIDQNTVLTLSKYISDVAGSHAMTTESCAEPYDLESVGIQHGKCVDDTLLERIGSYKLQVGKDKNQRKECGCVSSIDLGTYNTCMHRCRYCYANSHAELVKRNYNNHRKDSSLLIGTPGAKDFIRKKEMRSLRISQKTFDL